LHVVLSKFMRRYSYNRVVGHRRPGLETFTAVDALEAALCID
jgi:hypothetical protein